MRRCSARWSHHRHPAALYPAPANTPGRRATVTWAGVLAISIHSAMISSRDSVGWRYLVNLAARKDGMGYALGNRRGCTQLPRR